jgi:hypothetical protein
MQRRDNIAFEPPLNPLWTTQEPLMNDLWNTHEQGWFLPQLCLELTPPAQKRKGLGVSAKGLVAEIRKCEFEDQVTQDVVVGLVKWAVY